MRVYSICVLSVLQSVDLQSRAWSGNVCVPSVLQSRGRVAQIEIWSYAEFQYCNREIADTNRAVFSGWSACILTNQYCQGRHPLIWATRPSDFRHPEAWSFRRYVCRCLWKNEEVS